MSRNGADTCTILTNNKQTKGTASKGLCFLLKSITMSKFSWDNLKLLIDTTNKKLETKNADVRIAYQTQNMRKYVTLTICQKDRVDTGVGNDVVSVVSRKEAYYFLTGFNISMETKVN